VIVYPRREVVDAQGEAIRGALSRLGFGEVAGVRAGKSFDIELELEDRDRASQLAEEMCDKLLVNRLVEELEIHLLEEDDA
jgi:phosphoribosylformylglycinamidine synthase